MSDDPQRLEIEERLEHARALPPAIHHDPAWFRHATARVFARAWWPLPAALPSLERGTVRPWNLLPGCLDEPLLLAWDEQGPRVLDNACTHCGTVLVEREGTAEALVCRRHGRRFALDGTALHTPEREGGPHPADALAVRPVARWAHLLLTCLDPAQSVDALLQPLRERLGFLPLPRLAFESARDYHVHAGWATCWDHAADGIHGPVAGPDAAPHALHLLPQGLLRVQPAAEGAPCLTLPADHPDAGPRVASLHLWLLPGIGLDVHPWGIDTRLILPLGPLLTRVVVLHHLWAPELRPEDHALEHDRREHAASLAAEAAARGLRSWRREPAPYAPWERARHHVHRLLAAHWNEGR